ncbi:unnamed protein product, partial [Ectocarpus fasciculatus]
HERSRRRGEEFQQPARQRDVGGGRGRFPAEPRARDHDAHAGTVAGPKRRRHGTHGRILADVLHAQPTRRPAVFCCRGHGIRLRTRLAWWSLVADRRRRWRGR